MSHTKEKYRVARYERLSREDGDKAESDSIINQQYLLEDFCTRHPEFIVVDDYVDDGFTGTNFDRPAFRRMVEDIESGNGCLAALPRYCCNHPHRYSDNF